MDFNNYKKLLKSNGIRLFDHQYRLSYFKVNLVMKNRIQEGGGKRNNKILKKKNKNKLLNIVSYSLSNNINLGYMYYLIYNN